MNTHHHNSSDRHYMADKELPPAKCHGRWSQRLAVLELSSTSVKLLIGPANDDGHRQFDFCDFSKVSYHTATSAGLDERGLMAMDYFKTNVIPAISEALEVAGKKHVTHLRAVATAAYRGAVNRHDILQCVEDKCGVKAEVLSKLQEAEGVCEAINNTLCQTVSGHMVVIDQGGGSTEISVCNDGVMLSTVSLDFGLLILRHKLTEYLNQGLSLHSSLSQLDDYVNREIEGALNSLMSECGLTPSALSEAHLVAVGTSITTATGQRGSRRVHRYSLSLHDLISTKNWAIEQLADSCRFDESCLVQPDNDRQVTTGLTLAIGLTAYIKVMRLLSINRLTVSGAGLWYGIYFKALADMTDSNPPRKTY